MKDKTIKDNANCKGKKYPAELQVKLKLKRVCEPCYRKEGTGSIKGREDGDERGEG